MCERLSSSCNAKHIGSGRVYDSWMKIIYFDFYIHTFVCALERIVRIRGAEKKEDSLPDSILIFPLFLLRCLTTIENRRPSAIYFIVYNILCVRCMYIYIYSNSGNYCWDCRLSSVNRVIYKASVRPPQVITSVGPELGFLSAQQHATGTSGISFIGSFLLTFFADPVYKNVHVIFNRVHPKCIFVCLGIKYIY